MTKIKICGLQSAHEAEYCGRFGADAVGFIFAESKRRITADLAKEIAGVLPPNIFKVGVFVNSPQSLVEDVAENVGLTALQFHGDEDAVYCGSFTLPVIKAIRVRSNDDLHGFDEYPVAALLFDTYHSTLTGGTGHVFDWGILPQKLTKPVILAGGLHSGNVCAAIRQMKPYAVDVSSGVETSGRKDPEKIRVFIESARRCR